MGELSVLGRGHAEDESLYLADGHSRSNLVHFHIFVVHGVDVGVDVYARSGSINEGDSAYRGVYCGRKRDK